MQAKALAQRQEKVRAQYTFFQYGDYCWEGTRDAGQSGVAAAPWECGAGNACVIRARRSQARLHPASLQTSPAHHREHMCSASEVKSCILEASA